MVRFPRDAQCVYCGTAPADTVDHVPPKCLFAKANRNNLISVPSCRECNGSFAKDDEYFRQILAMDEKALESPDAQEVSETALRAMQRPDHRKMRESMRPNFRDVEDWTGGIFRGVKPGYEFDGLRINGIVSRIVKGLFWHENQEILPPSHEVRTIRYAHFDQYDISAMATIRRIYSRCSANGIQCVGDNAFEYAFSAADDDPHASCWILRFYRSDSFDFTSVTVPKKDKGKGHKVHRAIPRSLRRR